MRGLRGKTAIITGAAQGTGRAIAERYGEEGVRLIPMGRQGRPEDVARVAAFLASDDAAYMTGQAINVTGGLWLG